MTDVRDNTLHLTSGLCHPSSDIRTPFRPARS
jgi:hypothetical protein